MMDGPLVQEQRASDARTALLGIALLVDAAALVALRPIVADVAILRQHAAFHFLLLFVDLAVTRGVLARSPSARLPLRAVIGIEVLVLVAWLHAFGSTSTALLALGPALVLFYRVAHGREASAWCLALLIAGKLALFVFESFGVLRVAPLFGGEAPALVVRIGGLAIGAASDAGAFVLARLASAPRARNVSRTPATPKRATPARSAPRWGSQDTPNSVAPVIAGYELGELLGRGGMGDVHRAVRASDGKEVAIKILHAHLDGSSELIERFEREALFTEKLPSQRVARVLAVGQGNGLHWLVMDLLSGEDLAARLARIGTLPLEHAVVLVDHLAEVLDAAHAAGIVHRDVKPQNVFVQDQVDGAPAFRLLDFGVARLLEDPNGSRASKTVGLLGTPGYLAPEQVSDKFGPVSARTDVFAVGAVLYRALTGRSAFPSRQAAAAIHEAVHLHPPSPSSVRADLPNDVDHVVATALAKTPADRHASLGELARDLRLACTNELPEEHRARARSLANLQDASAGSRTITSAA